MSENIFDATFNSTTMVTKFHGVEVHVHDEVCESMLCGLFGGIPMAFAFKSKFDSRTIILINSQCLKEDEDFVRAVYYHELGHIHLNHIETIIELMAMIHIPGTMEKIDKYEMEADAYAVDHGADILSILKRFQKLGIPLLEARIAALENR